MVYWYGLGWQIRAFLKSSQPFLVDSVTFTRSKLKTLESYLFSHPVELEGSEIISRIALGSWRFVKSWIQLQKFSSFVRDHL